VTADRVALLLAGDDVYVFDAGDERIVIQYTVLVGANLDVDGPIYMTMEAWDRRFSALAPAEANIVDCRTGSGGRGRPGGTARASSRFPRATWAGARSSPSRLGTTATTGRAGATRRRPVATSDVWDARSIREWVLRAVTETADNSEPWYVTLTDAGWSVDGDARAKGEAVVAALRGLIDEEASGTARDLLYALLDLGDGMQAEALGGHYGEDG
jgi:hypothetical protein